jgi:DNA repair exonuclease SbcCD ATPase subunit
VASLSLSLGQKGSSLATLRAEMVDYVLARMPPDQHDAIDAEGGIPLIEAYRHYYGAEVAEREREIREIEDRIVSIAESRVGLPKGGVADRSLLEKIQALEAEAETKRASIVPIDSRIDALARELDDIREAIRSIGEHARTRRLRQATEELQGILSRIEVHAVDAGYGKSAAKRIIADRLTFVPVIGDPIGFQLDWPSRFRPETAERARELLDAQEAAGIIDLREIARTLTAEGHQCYADRNWSKRDVLRLLAGRIDATTLRAREQQSKPRRRGPAESDGDG